MGVMGMIHLIIAFMMCFLNVMTGMYEMIDVMILFCAVARMDYCCLICYLLNIFINLFQNINGLGLVIQDQDWNEIYNSGNQHRSTNFASTVVIMSTVYYIFAFIFGFYAYRWWKSQMQDM